MLYRPTFNKQNRILIPKNSTESPSTSKYGLLLLHIPSESLTHVTSHLDPKDLLTLGQVNLRLANHIKDDHTWHRAFAQQFLGVSPETDLDNAESLLFRRSYIGSWRQEFILHYSLRRRWEKCRNANSTLTHNPLNSTVSSMHLMPAHGLLTSSLQYGVVSRSFAFTGAVLRGYLDAAGSGGLGIGNPNTEFSPNVSACALGSDGGTAKIAWGFRNGEVAFTAANKAMDTGRRSAAKFTRCQVEEQHFGVVLDIKWDGMNAVSASSDGRVKLWDAKSQCVWTSECHAPDDCVKVASALSQGVIVAAMRSGDVVVWTGITVDGPTSDVLTITIPCPVHGEGASYEITGLHVDNCAPSCVLLATFADSHLLYRFDVNFSTRAIETHQIGDPALGAITSCAPSFTSQPGEHSFVITGTQLGCIGIYDWADSQHSLPTHKFEAYEDGAAVTALAWNGITLVTGCARGTTKAWDALTLECLRVWPTPVPRKRAVPAALIGVLPAEDPKVRQIVLGPEKETMFVAVGDRVMAFRAGPVPKGGGLKVRGSPAKRREQRTAPSKYLQQLEMKEEISSSRRLLDEESRSAQRAYGRAREQRAGLEELGLDEVEAVEYVLMLSREEAIERERDAQPPIEEGVFEGDFGEDEVGAAFSARSSRSSSSESPVSSPRIVPTHSQSQSPRNGRPIPRLSDSKHKLQVSPQWRPEPTEALFTPSPPSPRSLPPPMAMGHFPPISSAGSSASTSASPRASVSPGKSKPASAWGTPFGGRSPVPSPGTSVVSVSSRGASFSIAAARDRDGALDHDMDMDDDLRFAIELSLAEARSRGGQ